MRSRFAPTMFDQIWSVRFGQIVSDLGRLWRSISSQFGPMLAKFARIWDRCRPASAKAGPLRPKWTRFWPTFTPNLDNFGSGSAESVRFRPNWTISDQLWRIQPTSARSRPNFGPRFGAAFRGGIHDDARSLNSFQRPKGPIAGTSTVSPSEGHGNGNVWREHFRASRHAMACKFLWPAGAWAHLARHL